MVDKSNTTTTEERAAELEGVGHERIPGPEAICMCLKPWPCLIRRLIKEVERLLPEEQDKLSVLLQEEGERGGAALMERNDALAQLRSVSLQLAESRAEIRKLEEEILSCPADSAYHASRPTEEGAIP